MFDGVALLVLIRQLVLVDLVFVPLGHCLAMLVDLAIDSPFKVLS
jgi:hypothetical protein